MSGKLPASRALLVGRTDDMSRLSGLLGQRRLVTVTGVGGVGKRRLVLETAREVAIGFRVGCGWLSSGVLVTRPGSWPSRARRSACSPPGRVGIDVLCDQLGATHLLLVLDNCEHVLDAAVDVVSAVLDQCAGLTVLCTGREPLEINGEQVMPLAPLDPTGSGLHLLEERASALNPQFGMGLADRDVGIEICRRLDGLARRTQQDGTSAWRWNWLAGASRRGLELGTRINTLPRTERFPSLARIGLGALRATQAVADQRRQLRGRRHAA